MDDHHIDIPKNENPKKTSENYSNSGKTRFSDYSSDREKPPSFNKLGATLRFAFAKPKSRFVEEPPIYTDPDSSSHRKSQAPTTQEHTEDAFDDELLDKNRKKNRHPWCRTIIECLTFIVMTTGFTCSLTLGSIKNRTAWGLEIWKWLLMLLVMFCGRLFSGWLICLTVFIIERKYMFKYKVLYFVYGLRKSVQNCVWVGLVLLAWNLVFHLDDDVEGSSKHRRFLNKVSKGLLALLMGATVWLGKILLVKLLASSFHVNTFFDRIQESIFHNYILETLSSEPMDKVTRSDSKAPSGKTARWKKLVGDKKWWGSQRMDVGTLRMLSQERVSAWEMKRLVRYVRSSGFSTISRTVDETIDEHGKTDYDQIKDGKTESEIRNEKEARAMAKTIFERVAGDDDFIDVYELKRFFKEKEICTMIPLFEGAAESKKIQKTAFSNWVVKAYEERKALAHALNDTKTAVQQLHRLASAVVSVIIIVASLLIMGVATTKVLVFFTSQLVVATFIFASTCKTIFESIVFVFVMHPFDVGDRCVIDGVQMIVDEMNLLTTVFLRFDNEKIYYPNSVLLTKPISNFYRSPDMKDSVDFSIDVQTPNETVNDLRMAIKKYIERKPDHWSSKHWLVVNEIEDVNKMKMKLFITHTINHQNYIEKLSRRSEVVLALKDIFKELDIKYNLLPQDVNVREFQHAQAARVHVN